MTRKKGKGDVVNPYAKVIGSENTFVIPYAETRIDQDGTVEFYDTEKHKGKLTCPDCELPKLTFRRASETTGGKKLKRDHFARFPNDNHDLHCEVGLRALEYPGQDRVIDRSKAPYVYINTGKISPRPPYKSVFNHAASYIPPSVKLLPAWIKAIDYTTNSRDFPTIKNSDFRDRDRLNPIGGVKDYLRILKVLPPSKLSDTWVINNDVAVRFDKTVIRELNNDGKHDRFCRIIDECLQGIRHPILLHFKVDTPPAKMSGENGQRLRVTLAPFKVPNPQREKEHHSSLELPEVSVYRYIHIKDPAAFSQIKQGQEYFAIAHPYVFKDNGINGPFNLHFDIFRSCDIIQMTQQELADAIKKTSARREMHAQRKAETLSHPEKTPL